jgi:hypothetical protein
MGLAPWRWLPGIPEGQRQIAMALWHSVMQGLVAAATIRKDSRTHVSDLIGKGNPEVAAPQAKYFLDGTYRHMKWKAILEHCIGAVELLATEQEIMIAGDIIGTPDFVVRILQPGGGSIEFPVDVKSVAPSRYKQISMGVPLPRDRNQMLMYLDGGGWPFGFLIYEDRDTLEFALICVLPDPEQVQKIKTRRRKGEPIEEDPEPGQVGGEARVDPSLSGARLLPPQPDPGDEGLIPA